MALKLVRIGDRKGRPYNIRTGLCGALGYGAWATQEVLLAGGNEEGGHKGQYIAKKTFCESNEAEEG
jgi:hypothetical protein